MSDGRYEIDDTPRGNDFTRVFFYPIVTLSCFAGCFWCRVQLIKLINLLIIAGWVEVSPEDDGSRDGGSFDESSGGGGGGVGVDRAPFVFLVAYTGSAPPRNNRDEEEETAGWDMVDGHSASELGEGSMRQWRERQRQRGR